MLTLKEWRKRKALSQRDLAALSGIALSTICHLEQGRQKPKAVTHRKLAKALDVQPQELTF